MEWVDLNREPIHKEDLSKMKVAAGIGLSKEEVSAWLYKFTTGNINDDKFCHNIIDTFIKGQSFLVWGEHMSDLPG